eukprot:scaffold170135_cov24-Tisochrysis_lutea.AAC.5
MATPRPLKGHTGFIEGYTRATEGSQQGHSWGTVKPGSLQGHAWMALRPLKRYTRAHTMALGYT